jgi:hypothetical protein
LNLIKIFRTENSLKKWENEKKFKKLIFKFNFERKKHMNIEITQTKTRFLFKEEVRFISDLHINQKVDAFNNMICGLKGFFDEQAAHVRHYVKLTFVVARPIPRKLRARRMDPAAPPPPPPLPLPRKYADLQNSTFRHVSSSFHSFLSELNTFLNNTDLFNTSDIIFHKIAVCVKLS